MICCAGVGCELDYRFKRKGSQAMFRYRHVCSIVIYVCIIASSGCKNAPTKQAEGTSIPTSHFPVKQEDSNSPRVFGQWVVVTIPNELDHSTKVVVRNTYIVVRCGKKVDAYIMPALNGLGHSLKTDDYHEQSIGYRVDNHPIRRATWVVADSYDALFIPISTLREMLGGETLALEYTPEYQTPETSLFDLSGLRETLDQTGCLNRITATHPTRKSSEGN